MPVSLFNQNNIRLIRLAIRTARKRPIDYNERRYFQLHNVDGPEDDGAEDGGNEEILEEVELEPAEPPAKKRLMVFFNFSPENTQELSKLMGDYITVATRHSMPLQQDLMSRDRDLVIYATVAATLRHPDTRFHSGMPQVQGKNAFSIHL